MHRKPPALALTAAADALAVVTLAAAAAPVTLATSRSGILLSKVVGRCGSGDQQPLLDLRLERRSRAGGLALLVTVPRLMPRLGSPNETGTLLKCYFSCTK